MKTIPEFKNSAILVIDVLATPGIRRSEERDRQHVTRLSRHCDFEEMQFSSPISVDVWLRSVESGGQERAL
jgi:hypothetical protein